VIQRKTNYDIVYKAKGASHDNRISF